MKLFGPFRSKKKDAPAKIDRVKPHDGDKDCYYCENMRSDVTPAEHDVTLLVQLPEQDDAKYVLMHACSSCKAKLESGDPEFLQFTADRLAQTQRKLQGLQDALSALSHKLGNKTGNDG